MPSTRSSSQAPGAPRLLPGIPPVRRGPAQPPQADIEKYDAFCSFDDHPTFVPNKGAPKPTAYLQVETNVHVCSLCGKDVHVKSPNASKKQLLRAHPEHRSKSSSTRNLFVIPFFARKWTHEKVQVNTDRFMAMLLRRNPTRYEKVKDVLDNLD